MSRGPIAIIGGTGALGSGLAARCVAAGLPVLIGSRDKARADAAAEALGPLAQGATNADATRMGSILIITVPFAQQAATLSAIAADARGKLVIDTTVPLMPPKVARVQLPSEGSAARIAALALGADVRLVTAFHNVSAAKLRNGEPIASDILVFGDEPAARDEAIALIARMGLAALHGGPLDNAVAAEAMTSVLIGINKRYKVAEGAGLRITGLAPGSE